MLRFAPVSILLLLAFVACESPAGPPEQLEGAYYASSVNGHALPLQRIEWFSNSAGSCERALDGADLFFSGQTEFALFVHYTLDCQGAAPSRSNSQLQGVYTRDGNDVDLHPLGSSTDTIRDAGFSGRNIFIVIRRNEEDYRLLFVPQG
jgi:hypothetical protein